MYILIRFPPPPFFFFSRVITKADNAMGDNRKNKKQKIKPESPQSNTLDLKRLSKLDLEALLVSHPPTHAQRDKRKKETKKKIKKITKHKSTQTAKKFSFQSSQICDSNEGETKYGTRERKPCSPCGSDSSDRPGDLLEQRATGGEQPSEKGNSRPLMVSLHGTLQSMPRSKDVGTALPAPALLSFPVASLIDVNLLTCDWVLAALEPKCKIAVMRCT